MPLISCSTFTKTWGTAIWTIRATLTVEVLARTTIVPVRWIIAFRAIGTVGAIDGFATLDAVHAIKSLEPRIQVAAVVARIALGAIDVERSAAFEPELRSLGTIDALISLRAFD